MRRWSLLLVAVVGCSSESGGTSAATDSGTSVEDTSRADAMTEVGAPSDASVDVTPEVGADTGTTADTGTPADTATTPDASDAGVPSDTGIDAGPAGMPIAATKNTWTWVGFDDSTCDDGTPTGIGVNLTDASTNVLVFHMGGGACWDGQTCFVLRTATSGPYGSAQFDMARPTLATALFDRADPKNPFRDWSYVFVPYCTGDWHAGDNVANYVVSGMSKTYHHEGRKNVRAFLKRLGPTFAAPGKVAIAGASAGAYGAAFDYDLYRATWPSAKSYLVADSAPLLRNDGIPATLRNAFYASWRIDKFLDVACPSCKTDFSALLATLGTAYPSDRLGLLSYTRDATVSSGFLLTGAAFETALLDLGAVRYDPSAKARYFFATGTAHTMVLNWAAVLTGATDARTWITRQVTDDAAWASIKP